MTPSFIVQPTSAGFCGGAPGAAPRPAGTTQPPKSWPLNSGFQSPAARAVISGSVAIPPTTTNVPTRAATETEARTERAIDVMRSSIVLQRCHDDVINLLRALVAVARFDRVQPFVAELAFEESDRGRQIPARVDARVHRAGSHRKHRL